MDSRISPKRLRVRKSRGRGLRTTNGCKQCRRRHLKCDEVKPICSACAKKEYACEFSTPQSRRNLWSPLSNQPILAASPRTPVEQTLSALETSENSPTTHHTNQSIIVSNDTTEIAWPDYEVAGDLSPSGQGEQLIETQPVSNHSPIAWQHAFLSPSNASNAALRWFGLLANDAARENVQESTVQNSWANENLSLDHTGSDGRRSLTSLQQATRVLDSPSSYAGRELTQVEAAGNSSLGEERIWQSYEPIRLEQSEKKLLEHFVNSVSPWIDLFDPTTQFSTLVAHLAIHNAGLLNAILALSCRHLALNPKLGKSNTPIKEEEALQYYYQTLHYVQKAMKYSGYQTSLELLSTTLIISAYEMLDNSSKDWERHLEGVFLIQRSQTIHGESGGLHSAVWWAWLCQDIWAAFREKRKTLTFWVPQKPLSVLSPHELAARSIFTAAKVISYCADATDQANMGHQFDEAVCLHQMLDDWQKHLRIQFSPLPCNDHIKSYFPPIWIRPSAFTVAVQFYNVSKILLLAHKPKLGGLEEYLERQSVIKNHVENICGIALTLEDNPSGIISSQALYIGEFFNTQYVRSAAHNR
ncbi:uncharacterized protein N7483_003045 [Penicillium malachiteum]|uniref:uncharacterized protein n=1 Tax=Penicillium malachiteum TaxID=1324776 RepID=UPI0025490895|nr:uncharacterized protein N7483_003045 [Penicillium malachiteum]KAJ5737920.1 hypothetical protein N7483_003045 [Penicillium malachiteum]